MEKLTKGIKADLLICDARKIIPCIYTSRPIIDVAKCSGKGPNLAHVWKFRDEYWVEK